MAPEQGGGVAGPGLETLRANGSPGISLQPRRGIALAWPQS